VDSSLLSSQDPSEVLDKKQLQNQLMHMAMNGLRTLVVAYADLPLDWWEQWQPKYDFVTSLPEAGSEAKHQKGACSDQCRICAAFEVSILDTVSRIARR